MESAKPTAQHEWLRRLIGTWTYEHPGQAVEGQPTPVLRGTEVFRAIGDLWVQGEANGPMPDGSPSNALMTLGFDPAKGKFVGTWLGSMMSNLWIYEGDLDPNGTILRLYSNGPAMDGSANTEAYLDIIEFLSDTHRTLSGHTKAADGTWQAFMTGHYKKTA